MKGTGALGKCPRCGVDIPSSCKICWGCGEILDPRLIELAERADLKS